MKKVMCKKLKKEAEALDYLPYPGEIGKKIQENISKEGWELWVSHQTMLINEMRFSPVDPKARKFLEEEMEKFFRPKIKRRLQARRAAIGHVSLAPSSIIIT